MWNHIKIYLPFVVRIKIHWRFGWGKATRLAMLQLFDSLCQRWVGCAGGEGCKGLAVGIIRKALGSTVAWGHFSSCPTPWHAIGLWGSKDKNSCPRFTLQSQRNEKRGIIWQKLGMFFCKRDSKGLHLAVVEGTQLTVMNLSDDSHHPGRGRLNLVEAKCTSVFSPHPFFSSVFWLSPRI